MNQRITVCIDVDEDYVLEVNELLEAFRQDVLTRVVVVKNWDTAVDEIKD